MSLTSAKLSGGPERKPFMLRDGSKLTQKEVQALLSNRFEFPKRGKVEVLILPDDVSKPSLSSMKHLRDGGKVLHFKDVYPAPASGLTEKPIQQTKKTTQLPKLPNLFPDDTLSVTHEVPTILDARIDMVLWALMSKPKWWEKAFKHEIIAKWKREVEETAHLSEDEWRCIVQEFQWWATQYSPEAAPSPVLGVWQRTLPPAKTSRWKHQLNRWLKSLEDVRDWHPGSEQQVLDMVHPSLYCYVEGQTAVTRGRDMSPRHSWENGWKKAWQNATPHHDETPLLKKKKLFTSHQFQWLPAVVQVNEKGNAQFVSYVNNLHPIRHAHLYVFLEMLISTVALPLWERVLFHMTQRYSTRSKVTLPSDADLEPPSFIRREDYETEEEFEDAVMEEQENYNTAEYWNGKDWRSFVSLKTDLPLYTPGRYPLRGQRLQVIVKIASIELRPGQSYPGGSWHIEGMSNERIVASFLYYYDVHNITTSKLHFRRAFDPLKIDYPQDNHAFVRDVYGLQPDLYSDEIENVYDKREVIIEEGLAIAFPNTFHHRVEPFGLKNPKESGHRKIIAFFLVDPSRPIRLDTSNVPPQQLDWGAPDQKGMREDQAHEYRKALMAERSSRDRHSDQTVSEVFSGLQSISLCEH